MRIFIAIGISLCVCGSVALGQTSKGQEMIQITRSGTQPPQAASADYFTGSVAGRFFLPGERAGTDLRRRGHVRARRQDRVALASVGADSDRDSGHRPGAALGRSCGGNPAGRRGLDSARSEALARGRAEQLDDAHRHHGTARRQDCRMDGEGQRCAVRRAAQRSRRRRAARPSQEAIGDFAPKLAEITDDVLYGDIWERPELSKRDRSLVTVAALIAMNRPDQLRSHLRIARAKRRDAGGVDRDHHSPGVLRSAGRTR